MVAYINIALLELRYGHFGIEILLWLSNFKCEF